MRYAGVLVGGVWGILVSSAQAGPHVSVSAGWNHLSVQSEKSVKFPKRARSLREDFGMKLAQSKAKAESMLKVYQKEVPEACQLKEGADVDSSQGVFLGYPSSAEKINLFCENCRRDVMSCFSFIPLKKEEAKAVCVSNSHIRLNPHPYALSNKACGLDIDVIGWDGEHQNLQVGNVLKSGRFYPAFYKKFVSGLSPRVQWDDSKVPELPLVNVSTLYPEKLENANSSVSLSVAAGYDYVFRGFRSPVGFALSADAFYSVDFGSLTLENPTAELPVAQTSVELKTRHSIGAMFKPGLALGEGNRLIVFLPVSTRLTRYSLKGMPSSVIESKADRWMSEAGIKEQFFEEEGLEGAPLSLEEAKWKFGVDAGLGASYGLTSRVRVEVMWQHSLWASELTFGTLPYKGRGDLDIDRFGAQYTAKVSSQKVTLGLTVRL